MFQLKKVQDKPVEGGHRLGYKFLWFHHWVLAPTRKDCVIHYEYAVKNLQWHENKVVSLIVKIIHYLTIPKPQKKIVYPESVTREESRIFWVGRQELKDEYDNNKWLLPTSPNYKYDPNLK